MSVTRICNACLKVINKDKLRLILSVYDNTLPLEKFDFCSRNCLAEYNKNWDLNIDSKKDLKKKLLQEHRIKNAKLKNDSNITLVKGAPINKNYFGGRFETIKPSKENIELTNFLNKIRDRLKQLEKE